MRIITIILVYDNDSLYDDEKIARKVCRYSSYGGGQIMTRVGGNFFDSDKAWTNKT